MPEQPPFSLDNSFPSPEAGFDNLVYEGLVGPTSPNLIELRKAAQKGWCIIEERFIRSGDPASGVIVWAKFADDGAKDQFEKELEAAGLKEKLQASPEITKRYNSGIE